MIDLLRTGHPMTKAMADAVNLSIFTAKKQAKKFSCAGSAVRYSLRRRA
jgi:hypothetical protein